MPQSILVFDTKGLVGAAIICDAYWGDILKFSHLQSVGFQPWIIKRLKIALKGKFTLLFLNSHLVENICMTIPEDKIEEFQKLYRIRYGHEISKEFAVEQGLKLIRLLKIIYRPMTQEDFTKIQNERFQLIPEIIKRMAVHSSDVIV